MSEAAETEQQQELSEREQEQYVTLPGGEALTIEESREITRARETSLVVVAGSPDSGKTTLIASIFHCFQRGSFAGFSFSGSETCPGLDRRCFLGRTHSRGTEPTMERTKFGVERRLLHFRVRPTDLSEGSRDLLISDVSGEEFEEIRHSVDQCCKFPLFRRADHFVFLVDGKRLADSSQKHAAKVEAEQFLQLMCDAGQFTNWSSVHLLVAKCDLISSDPAKQFSKLLQTEIMQRFGGRIGNLTVGEIAARPIRENTNFQLGHGLCTPFTSWLERPKKKIDLLCNLSPESCWPEFDRFVLRQSTAFSK